MKIKSTCRMCGRRLRYGWLECCEQCDKRLNIQIRRQDRHLYEVVTKRKGKK